MSNHILNRPEKQILGVCYDLSIQKKINVQTLRILFIIAAFFWGIGIGVYFILYFTLKNQKDSDISNDDSVSEQEIQVNKVVNVTLTGGIIGLLADSPQNSLNNRIKKENENGWRVIQVIPADSGNIFLTILRLLILVFTLFTFTTANGYYIIMERK